MKLLFNMVEKSAGASIFSFSNHVFKKPIAERHYKSRRCVVKS